jgi:hypothetical protein
MNSAGSPAGISVACEPRPDTENNVRGIQFWLDVNFLRRQLPLLVRRLNYTLHINYLQQPLRQKTDNEKAFQSAPMEGFLFDKPLK